MSQTDPTVTTENEGLGDTDPEPLFQEQIREEGGTGESYFKCVGSKFEHVIVGGVAVSNQRCKLCGDGDCCVRLRCPQSH